MIIAILRQSAKSAGNFKRRTMETSNNPVVREDKTVAVLAYVTFIGFLIAMSMHSNKKTRLGTYHLRQGLALLIVAVGIWIAMTILCVIPFVVFVVLALTPFIWLGILALMIIGMINASNGQEKPLPLVGAIAERFFPRAFE
jgi:uncharacterized membrane protein